MRNRYSQDLRTPQWRILRRQVMARDGYACRHCGNIHGLEVHHISYIRGRRLYNYPLHWLITLCECCHDIQTKKQRQRRAVRRYKAERRRRYRGRL